MCCTAVERATAPGYVLHRCQCATKNTKLHHEGIAALVLHYSHCNTHTEPQHTILQRACRETSMHPMEDEYTVTLTTM